MEGLRDIAKMQFPSPGSVDSDLALYAFEFDVIATTLQVHCALYSLGSDHIAPAHIHMQTTPEILDPHSGSFAIDIDIALKIVNVVVTVTGAGLKTGSRGGYYFQVGRDIPFVLRPILIGSNQDRISLLQHFEMSNCSPGRHLPGS